MQVYFHTMATNSMALLQKNELERYPHMSADSIVMSQNDYGTHVAGLFPQNGHEFYGSFANNWPGKVRHPVHLCQHVAFLHSNSWNWLWSWLLHTLWPCKMTLLVIFFKFSSERIYENLSKDSKFSKDSSIDVLLGECSSERTFKNFYLETFGVALGCSCTIYSAATFDTLSLSHTHTHTYTRTHVHTHTHAHTRTNTLSLSHTHTPPGNFWHSPTPSTMPLPWTHSQTHTRTHANTHTYTRLLKF